ncbi:hypothetical protein ACFVS7_03145 [Streptomyces rubiginosohelvolus]|uniref:hypothetical protein n=1 Tax=Streptomyces rubiginosohelvolus TaxID=67362 RepID=UPI0036DB11B0
MGSGNIAATGCFKPYGDVVFASDHSPDGHSVYTLWQNQLRDKNAWGGKGSKVRVKACVADFGDDTCGSWSSWIYND